MNKMNPFSAFTAPCQLIFLSNLSITDEASLVPNSDETSSAKGTARSVSVSLPKLIIILPRNPPGWII